ncbi:hypothetical protein PT974_05442 [Cladobotryum mycophilum]|uniref:Nucleoside phosphorylase domain-containing protein n=1 Tax=Cladobotryum mycophilum TaxID=491253 RepID=A0ABR0SK00_9HYPO
MDPNIYTVGWVCAVPVEYVAAQLFLDEEHQAPRGLPKNDHNTYKLGRMGRHNVVIAVLPDSEHWSSSAARAAADLHHSFPNVGIGLIVGIGGGAPTRDNQVRLGDVVVGSPRHGTGGILPYDSGRVVQDQPFRISRFLNQPPPNLLTAVQGIKAKYLIYGNRLEATISAILDGKPKLWEYQRPDPSSDRLYRSDILHPNNNDASSKCADVCGDGPSSLIFRPPRTEDEDDPAIHYGIIASANKMMKDAKIRDEMAAERNVLCFDMVSAGLVNHFPCLVIRGISNYADTHKNDEWHGYAAMAAAAYAKDLLSEIVPRRGETEKRIGSQPS